MARTAITIQTLPTTGAGDTDLAFTAADATNDMSFANDGKTLFFVKNASASPVTATVVSVADEYGRTGDLAFVVAAGKTGVCGPFRPQGIWNQSTGLVHVDFAADTDITVAALKLP